MKIPSKRKMYQKRRKKEKAEKRKKEFKTMSPGKTAFYKSGNKGTQNNRNSACTNKYHQQFSPFNPITSYSKGLQLWWQTYCSAIEFHSQQQNAWQAISQDNNLTLLHKYANEYETSSEEEEENERNRWRNISETTQNANGSHEEECIDEQYIKFLEITHKHQEELRLKRAEDNC